MMKSAYMFLLTLAFLCLFKVGLCELCSTVRASRASKFVAERSSLRLSCEVRHCGVSGWTGGWFFQEINSTRFTRLTLFERIELSNYSSTAKSTHLLVDIHNINQSNAGAYKCMVTWPDQSISNGHVTNVNVTAAVESSGRILSHRVLLCLCATMCFPLVLGLVWCLTRDHPPPPPVPPRSYTSFARKNEVKSKKELVYAEIALNSSRRQNDCPKRAPEPTVYSSVHFS
ncbi:uncharacterized protein si:dkey-52l18.4 isoform X2 [Pseudorasbora parva]|uniref:uncharacterized protein si:dkey-52l18.4 isoform X2 n=1 Tax=Pseudorasbora parva TaxID=51549 RepID=UPI00351E8BA6